MTLYLKSLAIKMLALCSLYGVSKTKYGQDSIEFFFRSSLKISVTCWNTMAKKWNSGGKDKILKSITQSSFYPTLEKNCPEELKIIMGIAQETKKLPIAVLSDTQLKIYDPDTKSELLKVHSLKQNY